MTGLLTARQVADMLGVSAETILRWTRRGELSAIRLPSGQIRYREEEIDGWLAERTTVTTTCVDPPAPCAASWDKDNRDL
jgi:excisionase family DNA binding protein